MSDTIDTEMYLRDGAPYATVCKVAMKDGRMGVGMYRLPPGMPMIEQDALDARALSDALAHLIEPPIDHTLPHGFETGAQQEPETDEDLQAALGQKAHE